MAPSAPGQYHRLMRLAPRRPTVRIVAAREDRSLVVAIRGALDAAGVATSDWLTTGLPPGAEPATLDAHELRRCDAMVAVVSRSTPLSAWTMAELCWAHDEHRPAFAGITPHGAMPVYFVHDGWLDGSEAEEEAFRRFQNPAFAHASIRCLAEVKDYALLAEDLRALLGRIDPTAFSADSRERAHRLLVGTPVDPHIAIEALGERLFDPEEREVLRRNVRSGAPSHDIINLARERSAAGRDGGRLAWLVEEGEGLERVAVGLVAATTSGATVGDRIRRGFLAMATAMAEDIWEQHLTWVRGASGRLESSRRHFLADRRLVEARPREDGGLYIEAALLGLPYPRYRKALLVPQGVPGGRSAGVFSGGWAEGPAVVMLEAPGQLTADTIRGEWRTGSPYNATWFGPNGTPWGGWRDGAWQGGRDPALIDRCGLAEGILWFDVPPPTWRVG